MALKKFFVIVRNPQGRFPVGWFLPSELFPLFGRPIVDYIIDEIESAEGEEVVFVCGEKTRKLLQDYAREKSKSRDNFHLRFEYLAAPEKPSDAQMLYRIKQSAGKSGFAIIYPSDFFLGRKPILPQAVKMFNNSQKPVLILKRGPGVAVKTEKIASRFYKIKGFEEGELSLGGRYILEPGIFESYRKGMDFQALFEKAVLDGKTVYGYEADAEHFNIDEADEWFKAWSYLRETNKGFI